MRRILFVDDDLVTSAERGEACKRWLECRGVTVDFEFASTYKGAEAALVNRSFDLVVLDVAIPSGDPPRKVASYGGEMPNLGLVLLAALREGFSWKKSHPATRQDVPVIILSGDPERLVLERKYSDAIEGWATRWLEKPVTTELLGTVIQSLSSSAPHSKSRSEPPKLP
jgi:CheY-like chemotaxis protein